MQDREPIIPDHIWSLPRKPAGLPDLLSRTRDDVLVLREPYGERARPLLLATMALAVSFALGWAGALHWPEVANLIGVDQIAQKDVPSPAIAEAKPGQDGRHQKDGIRARLAKCSTRHRRQHSKTLRHGGERGLRLAGQYESSRSGDGDEAALAPAPETRPTTIPGWTVVEVRDGTAVLEGPEGIKMAARGDTIPGIGRIDSIVRWGNRWIVATAHGLIATQ